MANDNPFLGHMTNRRLQSIPQAGCARGRRAGEPSATIITLQREGRANRREGQALPKDHVAEIVLFTGVQIVRNGTQG